jgi:hypothetical protein
MNSSAVDYLVVCLYLNSSKQFRNGIKETFGRKYAFFGVIDEVNTNAFCENHVLSSVHL